MTTNQAGPGIPAERLIELLQRTCAAIQGKDTFQGRIEYEVRDGQVFNVSAAVRIGNSMGQGGMILIQDWVDAQDGGEIGPTYTRKLDAMCGSCGEVAEQLQPIVGAEGPTFLICSGCGHVEQVGAGVIELERPT